MSQAVRALLRELQAVLATATQGHPERDLFAGIDTRLGQEGTIRSVPGRTRAVVERWLEPSVAAAPDPWATLAQRLLAAAPELPWVRSYENLESTPALEAFREFYSYQLFAGPVFRGNEPPILLDDVLVGFSLQAPNVFYPAHHHAPPELYGVISGTLEWQVGETWRTVEPGDVIMHRPHESHAMRTGDEPALTWVVWPCDPDTNVYMPSLDPPEQTMAPRHY